MLKHGPTAHSWKELSIHHSPMKGASIIGYKLRLCEHKKLVEILADDTHIKFLLILLSAQTSRTDIYGKVQASLTSMTQQQSCRGRYGK